MSQSTKSMGKKWTISNSNFFLPNIILGSHGVIMNWVTRKKNGQFQILTILV
jgi:hypothetical protein